MAADVEIPI